MYDPFDYFGVLFGVGFGVLFAVLFYRIGEADYEKGYLTALISVAVTLIACFWVKMGLFGVFAGHVLLYFAMWIYNAQRDAHKVK